MAATTEPIPRRPTHLDGTTMPLPMSAAMEAVVFPARGETRSVRNEACGQRRPAHAPSSLVMSLRHALRAFAGDPAHWTDRRALHAAAWPIIDATCAELDEWRAAGTSDRQLALVWTRLVDAAVVESYRLARFQSGGQPIVAPLTVVALGAYGAQALLRAQQAGLLLLVPADRRELAGRRMAQHLIENLAVLGLAVAHTTGTPGSIAAVASDDHRVAGMLATGRHLTGSYGPWAALRAHA